MRYTILTLTIQQNTLCLDGTEIWYMPEIVLSLRESRSQKRTYLIHLRDFYNDPDFSILLHKRSNRVLQNHTSDGPKPIEKERKWIFFLSLTITFLIGLIEVKRRQ